MSRKGVTMLMASILMMVSFSGDRVKTALGNSNWKRDTSTMLNQTDRIYEVESGDYAKAESRDLYAARQNNAITGMVKPPVSSGTGDFGAFQMQTVTTPPEQFDYHLGKLADRANRDADYVPKTVTVSIKKEIKKTEIDKPLSERIADYAYTFSKQYRAQQGLAPIPYKYGSEGPNSFDCSGFVGYVYKHFGISLPRTTREIIGQGKAVSRKDLRPGDIVFSSAGHVELYIGNGQVVHAPETGDVVKVSSLRDEIYAARRIVN